MSADYRRMIQEQLDGALDAEQAARLAQHLAAQPEAVQEQAQLQQVHTLLTKPPHVRVPQRLAATIMARLAQHLQEEAQMQPLSQETRLALMASLSVVTMAMMPMMVSASYMVLVAQRSPALLSQVSLRVVALMVIMVDAITILLEEIEAAVHKNPRTAPVAFYLIPIALRAMLDYLEGDYVTTTSSADTPPDEADTDDYDDLDLAAFHLSR